MSVEIASLRIEIDATDAKTAKVSLDDLTKSGATLEQQAGKLSRSQRDVGVSHGLAGTAAGQAEKSMRSLAAVYGDARDSLGRFTKVDGTFRASQEATALMAIRNAQAAAALAKQQEQAAATTASYASKVAGLKAQLDPFAAVQLKLSQNTRLLDEALAHGAITANQHATALSQVTRAALADVQAIDRMSKGHVGAAGTAKQLQYAGLNMGRQFADIGTQLGSGQGFGIVLIQQGPQILDIFSQLKAEGIGVKAALAGMAAELAPFAVAAAPFIALAAAIGLVAYAAIQGEKDVNDFSNAIAITGNSAQLTGEQYEAMATRVALGTQSGFGVARKTLLELVESGKFSGETIETLAVDIVKLSEFTGKSADEITARFTGMKGSVADFAAQFHDDYKGLLTPAVIEHIEELEQQGKRTEAVHALSVALYDDLGDKGPAKLGALKTAWVDLSDQIGIAFGLLKGFAGANPAAGEAARTQLRIQQLQGYIGNDKQALASGQTGLFVSPQQIQTRIGGYQAEIDRLTGANKPKAKGGDVPDLVTSRAASDILDNLKLQLAETEKINGAERVRLAGIKAANDAVSKGISGPALENIRKLAQQVEQVRVNRDAAAAGRRGESLVLRGLRADDATQDAIDKAAKAELIARRGLTSNIELLAGFRKDEITQEAAAAKANVDREVGMKKINAAMAPAIKATIDRTAALKVAASDQQLFNEQLARARALEDTIAGYTDRQAQSQLALATSLEKAQAIENKAIAERQAREQGRRDFDLFMEWVDGKKTEAEVHQVQDAAAGADAGARAVKAQEDRVAIIERDLGLRNAALEDAIAVLESERQLARSASERQAIERRILAYRQETEINELNAAINAASEVKEREKLVARLARTNEVQRNDRIQAENDRMVANITDLGDNLSQFANAFDQKLAGQISQGFQHVAQAFAAGGPIAAALAAFSEIGAAIGGGTGAFLQGFGSGGLLGGALSLFGHNKAKKKARARAAAQAAAEEAARQDQIADYTGQIEIDTLRASGNEGAALALERTAELAALAKLSPALVELKTAYYAAADAADAAAKAAEKAAQVDAKRASIQDEIDKLTLSSGDLLAASRAKERAEAVALDPALGALIDKLFGLQDAAASSASAAEQLAASAEAHAKAAAGYQAYMDKISEANAAALERQAAATQSLNEALSQGITNLQGLTKSLREFAGEIGDQNGFSGNYDATRSALLGEASSGRLTNLQSSGEAFLKASEAKYGDTAAYRRDAALVRAIALAGADRASNSLANFATVFGSGAAGFATGGGFEVGGSGPPDSKLFNLALSPGEMVNVTRPGTANDNSEVAALREEVARMSALLARIANSNDKMERTLTNVTEGGRAMQTEAAS
jgi:hypothetical protein